jgi:ribosomal protein L16/L10AE
MAMKKHRRFWLRIAPDMVIEKESKGEGRRFEG